MFSLFWSHLNVFEYKDFSDLSQTLENFSGDSWKTLRRHLEKSFKAFYAIRLPTKSSAISDTNFEYVFCVFNIFDSKKL